jgi:hypothetical protein
MESSRNPATRRLKLQDEIGVCSKSGDKNKLVKTLREAKFLQCIKMDHISSLKVRDAERRVQSERAIINRVQTFPGSSFHATVQFVKDACKQIVNIHDLPLDPQTVYESVICRMSRPIAAADAYSKLKRIIKASNLSLIRIEDSNKHPPCEVEIFECNGELHVNILSTVSFGLVRSADLMDGRGDINLNGYLISHKKADPVRVWFTFDVVVKEKMNLSTGDFLRFASVRV